MSGINTSRVLLGGLVAGAVIWLMEGFASVLYMDDLQADLAALGLSMDMSASTWILTVLVSLLIGLTLVFLYAAARPRFGPGPKTAALIAVVVWLGAYLTQIIGYHMLEMFRTSLLVTWAVVGLVEVVVAAIAGGAVYKE
ncbi:MAG: hypothetical protein R3325_00700 [Thermoanaerobaculia bacterium]|nr:hypothetical protein [Thermoanaerobaculia bacterium]